MLHREGRLDILLGLLLGGTVYLETTSKAEMTWGRHSSGDWNLLAKPL